MQIVALKFKQLITEIPHVTEVTEEYSERGSGVFVTVLIK